jgi:hypothetical protein
MNGLQTCFRHTDRANPTISIGGKFCGCSRRMKKQPRVGRFFPSALQPARVIIVSMTQHDGAHCIEQQMPGSGLDMKRQTMFGFQVAGVHAVAFVKIICGILVILGGVWFIYSAP